MRYITQTKETGNVYRIHCAYFSVPERVGGFESSGCGYFHTSDKPLFIRLKQLASGEKEVTVIEDDRALILVGEKEPLFEEIKSLLEKAGVAFHHGFLMREMLGKYCPIFLRSPLTTKELAAAKFLRIVDVEPEVGRYLPPNLPEIPAMAPLTEHEVIAWCQSSQVKRNSPVGALEGTVQKSFVWLSEGAVHSAMEADIRLKVNPVRWLLSDIKAPEFKPFVRAGGWLGADTVLPKCLTPFKWLHGPNVGELASGDITDVYPERTWDGEGRMEPILKFRRSEVEKLGPFDVAHTWEKSVKATASGHYMPALIVSQRFRQWVSKNHYKIRFAPVELVDE
jgi:hypothetical protein